MPPIQRIVKPVRMDETAIQNAIRERLGREPDLVLWRNAQVKAEIWDEKSGDVRHVRGGLGEGSVDLIGVLTVVLHGRDFGRFIALEVKKPGRERAHAERVAAQETWMAMIRRRGGFAAFVTSPEEAVAALQRARGGASS